MVSKKPLDEDLEFAAMRAVYQALEPLGEQARERVISYVSQRLSIQPSDDRPAGLQDCSPAPKIEEPQPGSKAIQDDPGGPLDGISPVAVKWMKRAGISAGDLSKIFSIDLDEIDLVAESVPGGTKRERVRNVFRLTAIAEYLRSGAARVSHEDLKEACLHYDAYDVNNHATNLSTLGREISGTKESGYTLSATGITAATKLVKQMAGESS